MTHEELLNKLEEESDFGWVAFALRTVVELHKPESVMTPCPEGRPGCAVLHYADRNSCSCGFWNYPCPTIQAIEKELR